MGANRRALLKLSQLLRELHCMEMSWQVVSLMWTVKIVSNQIQNSNATLIALMRRWTFLPGMKKR